MHDDRGQGVPEFNVSHGVHVRENGAHLIGFRRPVRVPNFPEGIVGFALGHAIQPCDNRAEMIPQ